MRFLSALAFVLWAAVPASSQEAKKPNIIFILADDLGYGDIGCFGQKKIKTPNLDRMAAQGMRFTQAYAGSTVCAPSRCALMTGKHTGHARVRGNALVPLRPSDITVASLLQRLGYFCGLVGKWGLGEPATTGVPDKHGFGHFFGYLNQTHAHNYYPDYLWRNQEKITLGNVVEKGVATKRVQYSHDLFTEEAVRFLEKQKSGPFFLYLAYTLPHANNEAGKRGMEIPSDEPYSKENWPEAQRNHAAMITRLDRDVGRIFEKLAELGIDENTIVFFTSDNGPHQEGGADPNFFNSSGLLRGIKRSMHDGGIRVPAIVRWPGKIPAGKTNTHVWAFWDFLPTAVELASGQSPKEIDGISILPTLLGKGRQQHHEFLYWEFHEKGFQQAVRTSDWKAIRPKLGSKLELYDLANDIGESKNVADQHPDVIERIETYLRSARTDSDDFPVRAEAKKKTKS
ncbi:MAG: arylsulfatase [Gemmataceae bacterium]